MIEYILEVHKSNTGRVCGSVQIESGRIVGAANDLDSLEQEFKEYIAENCRIPISKITFDYEM